MNKTVIAIAFSVIFASFSVAPSILAIVDDSYDISILINSSEEEEKKGEEMVKDFELPINTSIDYNFNNNCIAKILNIHSTNYDSLYKELISPPPEVSIL